MRKFEKISFNEWKKSINNNRKDYDNHPLPRRHTKYSAGYDLVSPIGFILHPGEVKKVPTGIKIQMNDDDMMMLVVRSSTGFKYNVRLTNQIGIFESDYYNNEQNEGHAWISLQNHSNEDFVIKKGDRIVQAIFVNYLTVDDEEEIKEERIGGFGSTNKEEKHE